MSLSFNYSVDLKGARELVVQDERLSFVMFSEFDVHEAEILLMGWIGL
jgi:hypothetical protein